jgi:hypothetical protein
LRDEVRTRRAQQLDWLTVKTAAFDAFVAAHGTRYAIDARFVTRMQDVELRAVEIAFKETVTADRVGRQHADAANRRKRLPHMRKERSHEVGDR